ncbi:hypothetical protein PR202_gb15440 [Eleusine coracana subsp. coracana]|uniref:WRKY domain-containing protein n=1 Tax=Eleusine coracana subsp. coracana TaxID=191504 RepID=A0AAV5EXV7_ELECO|nr:hypothetical protein PR202_gb15440 [Eleusine coracana subsp. coracana]
MASRLKRKQGAVMVSALGSHGLPEGMFSLSPPESSTRDARKKRKNKQSSWVNHTYTPYFDGHLWRKYGQKTIKDAAYPRLYFRCSYREDRHCMASKRLQQVNCQDPPLFEVTYMHEHTCNAEPVLPPDVGDAAGPPPEASDGFVLSFGSSGGAGHHRNALMHQKLQHPYQCQPVPAAQFPVTNFDSWNEGQLHEKQAFLPPNDFPEAAVSAFPTVESSPESSSSSNCDDYYLFPSVDWDSFRGLIDQFDDHSQYTTTQRTYSNTCL